MVRRRLAAALAAGAIAAASAAVPALLGAQRIAGTVRDSASREPLPGAVVTLLDARGAVLARVITPASGEFSAEPPAGAGEAHLARVVRIGFRPRDVTLPNRPRGAAPAAPAVRLEIALAALPTLLEPVAVRANPRCTPRADRLAAFALLEQARDGLLSSVVARDATPATLVRLVFDRAMEGTSDRIMRQSVRIDSTAATTASFEAAHSARDFARRGFMRDSAGYQYFYAPDADVLLDEAFATAYCFHIAADSARPRDVGLAFEPADRRRGRVDVIGTLWVDTIARALRDVQFRFVGLPDDIMRLEPGGMTGFREVRPGIVLVDRWSLRLAASTLGTTFYHEPGGQSDSLMRTSYYLREAGGVLARAVWPDGTAWQAALAEATGRVTRSGGGPAPGVTLSLVGAPYHKGFVASDAETPYRAVTDSAGRYTIGDLLPGPYSVVILEPRFRSIGFDLPTGASFAVRGDTAATADVRAPTATEFVSAVCRERARLSRADSVLIFGRAMTPSRAPLAGVHVTAARSRVTNPSAWLGSGRFSGTGTDGLFVICEKAMPDGTLGDSLWLSAQYENKPLAELHVPVTGLLTVVPIRAAPRPP